ncbi:uncharacterized protein AAES06_006688 isoform 1-T1 [Glossophaga mutica]
MRTNIQLVPHATHPNEFSNTQSGLGLAYKLLRELERALRSLHCCSQRQYFPSAVAEEKDPPPYTGLLLPGPHPLAPSSTQGVPWSTLSSGNFSQQSLMVDNYISSAIQEATSRLFLLTSPYLLSSLLVMM